MIELLHSQLRPDPGQVRRSVQGLRRLADSICEYGLLQNLVVKEAGDGYVIVAGERRYQAIGLLIEQGRWDPTDPIPCMPCDDAHMWVQIVENDQRKELDPWDLGHRFCELIEAGATQLEIAGRLHTYQGRVSQHVQIAQGLSPAAVAALRKQPGRMAIGDLLRISKLSRQKPDARKGVQEPDAEAQLELIKVLAGARGRRKVRRRQAEGPKERDAVFRRYKRLRDAKGGETLDEDALIRAFVDYLSGKTTSLKLREFRIERL